MASLADGTPLVTGARRGKGWLILVHTTANTAWTTLPLSGLFVQMLERVLALGPGVGGTQRAPLEPSKLLDAFGRLGDPQGALAALAPGRVRRRDARPAPPAGTLRAGRTRGRRRRRQPRPRARRSTCSGPSRDLPPLGAGATGASVEGYARAAERDLAPWLMLVALLLALADLAIALALARPGVRSPARPAATAALLLLSLPGPGASRATGDDSRIVDLTRETRLAYVLTGRTDIDKESEAGLKGLTRVLAMRTSIEAGRSRGRSTSPPTSWPCSRCSTGRSRRTIRTSRRAWSSGSKPIWRRAA